MSQTASPAILELKSRYGVPVKDDKVPWGVVWSADKYKLGDDLIEISSESVPFSLLFVKTHFFEGQVQLAASFAAGLRTAIGERDDLFAFGAFPDVVDLELLFWHGESPVRRRPP